MLFVGAFARGYADPELAVFINDIVTVGRFVWDFGRDVVDIVTGVVP